MKKLHTPSVRGGSAQGLSGDQGLHAMIGAAVLQHVAKKAAAGSQRHAALLHGFMQAHAAMKASPSIGGVMKMQHGAGRIGAMGKLYKPMVGGMPKPGGVSVGNNLPNS